MSIEIKIPVKEQNRIYPYDTEKEIDMIFRACEKHYDCAVFELENNHYHVDVTELLRTLPVFVDSKHEN